MLRAPPAAKWPASLYKFSPRSFTPEQSARQHHMIRQQTLGLYQIGIDRRCTIPVCRRLEALTHLRFDNLSEARTEPMTALLVPPSEARPRHNLLAAG